MNELDIAYDVYHACETVMHQFWPHMLMTRRLSDQYLLATYRVQAVCAEAVYVVTRKRMRA